MWDLVSKFNMYDPLALLAAIPARRKQFFEAKTYVGIKGTVHEVIGLNAEQNGVRRTASKTVPVQHSGHDRHSKSGLEATDSVQDYLLTSCVRAAGRPRCGGAGMASDDRRPESLE